MHGFSRYTIITFPIPAAPMSHVLVMQERSPDE